TSQPDQPSRDQVGDVRRLGEHGPQEVALDLDAPELVDLGARPATHETLQVEDLDDRMRHHHLFEVAVDLGQALLASAGHPLERRTEQAADDHVGRHDQQYGHGELPAQADQPEERNHDQDDV